MCVYDVLPVASRNNHGGTEKHPGGGINALGDGEAHKWGWKEKCTFWGRQTDTQRFIYSKLASGAESHYEICCFFPQNARTLHAVESSSFIGFLCRLLRSSDLDLVTTLSYKFLTEGVPKSQNNFFTFGYNSG